MEQPLNTVYLLVGQRGAGKTHYGTRLCEAYPHLIALSRDEIMIRKYGSVHSSAYSGHPFYAMNLLTRLIRRHLMAKKGVSILLDAWTSRGDDRKRLINSLRACGADRVIALYFITPLEFVNKWFWLKPGIARLSEMKTRKDEGLVFFSNHAPTLDYEIFHTFAVNIDTNGFDSVIRINPALEGPVIQLP